MASPTKFNTLSNIVLTNKKCTFFISEINSMSAHLNYSALLIQSEIFPVLPSKDKYN